MKVRIRPGAICLALQKRRTLIGNKSECCSTYTINRRFMVLSNLKKESHKWSLNLRVRMLATREGRLSLWYFGRVVYPPVCKTGYTGAIPVSTLNIIIVFFILTLNVYKCKRDIGFNLDYETQLRGHEPSNYSYISWCRYETLHYGEWLILHLTMPEFVIAKYAIKAIYTLLWW